MSKKNLARTVIEGGRSGAYKHVRDQTNKMTRRKGKIFCKKLTSDIDYFDDTINENFDYPFIDYIDSKFKDKLGALENWLDKQVGRNWNEVYSEITSVFDSRTTAGRHILFDHLLISVDISGNRSWRDYFVDDTGILATREAAEKFGTGDSVASRYTNFKDRNINILDWCNIAM